MKRRKQSGKAKQINRPEFVDQHKINAESLKGHRPNVPHEMWFRVR
ncbi:hypothetical protein [Zhihengliuella sp.]|nr:hypothetical protein [Zhihengliuella sp.]